MQTLESTMEAAPRNQPPMQKPSRPPKIKTNFGNNGAIIKKQEVF
jgi:hypothetical protein